MPLSQPPCYFLSRENQDTPISASNWNITNELPLEATYLLDIGVTKRAIQDLRKRLHAVEGLLKQFGDRDGWEYYDTRQEKIIIRHDRRLVCKAVAVLNARAYPEGQLFISWPKYRDRRPAFLKNNTLPKREAKQ